jgi:hypothetical protein
MPTALTDSSGFRKANLTSEPARMIAGFLGIVFIAIGFLGFVSPGLMHTHLSVAHNLVHLISGAMALFFAAAGSLRATRLFNGPFGGVYFLLGLAGFIAGGPGSAAVGHTGHDDRLLRVIPGVLELGTMDHIVHVVVGLLFMVGAMTVLKRRSMVP